MKSELGYSLMETLVALAILGIVAAIFLSGMATTTKANIVTDKKATAESLVFGEIEYVKNYEYQYDASEYAVDPALTIPEGWAVPQPVVELVHATDDGMQEVTVTAEYDGEAVLSVGIYKVDR